MFACEYGQTWAPRVPETHASMSEYDALHSLVRDLEQKNRVLARSNSQLLDEMNRSDARLRSALASSGAGRETRESRFHPATGRAPQFKRSSAVERVRAQPRPARQHRGDRGGGGGDRGGGGGGGGGGGRVGAGAGGGGGFSDTRGAQDAEESSRDPAGVLMGGDMYLPNQ